jgi:hypothetical protein
MGGVDNIPVTLPKETRWIKITSPCKNVGGVEISREGDKFNRDFHDTQLRRGKEFTTEELAKIKVLSLEVKADFYGGVFKNKKINIKFNG